MEHSATGRWSSITVTTMGLLVLLISGINVTPSHAKLGPISISSVYTTAKDFSKVTEFFPGDKINYHVDVEILPAAKCPLTFGFRLSQTTIVQIQACMAMIS